MVKFKRDSVSYEGMFFQGISVIRLALIMDADFILYACLRYMVLKCAVN